MKKVSVMSTFFSIFVLLLINMTVYAVYQQNYMGIGNLEIAVPQIEMQSQKECINMEKNEIYTNLFKVRNYNEKGTISEVDLNYQIGIKVNFEDSPLNFKLYQIKEDGSEEEIQLTSDLKSQKTYQLIANKREEHTFKLEISYDDSGDDMQENTEISVELEAVN